MPRERGTRGFLRGGECVVEMFALAYLIQYTSYHRNNQYHLASLSKISPRHQIYPHMPYFYPQK